MTVALSNQYSLSMHAHSFFLFFLLRSHTLNQGNRAPWLNEQLDHLRISAIERSSVYVTLRQTKYNNNKNIKDCISNGKQVEANRGSVKIFKTLRIYRSRT